jgi:NADH-quinone oxidoreductase subunit C
MSRIVLERLQAKFGAKVLETGSSHGDEWAVVEPSTWFLAVEFLRDDPACDMSMFIDITAVDYPRREARFDLLVMLYSLNKGHRVRLKTRLFEETVEAGVGKVDPARPSRVSTLTPLYAAANWFEREVWDMFGVRFDGHPDLRRILMYEEFIGHPLRKDYDAAKAQPLVPYREEAQDKLPPFLADEGMSFSRNDWESK